MSDRARGLILVLTGTLLWSTSGIFIAYLLANYAIQPLTLTFWRAIFSSLPLMAFLAWRAPAALRISRRDLPFFAVYGGLGLATFNGLWTYSVLFNGAAVATVLAYTAPVFTVFLARPLLREPVTWRKLLAAALALGGCVLVAQAYRAEAWRLNLAGIAAGFGTGFLFALFSVAGRWSAGRFASSWTVTAYGFLFAALGLSLTQNAGTLFTMGAAWAGWGLLFALAVGPSLMGYGLFTVSLRYLPAGVAGLITALEPALTALLAIALLSERLDGPQWLGIGLILAAVVLAQGEAGLAQPPAPLPDAAAALELE